MNYILELPNVDMRKLFFILKIPVNKYKGNERQKKYAIHWNYNDQFY